MSMRTKSIIRSSQYQFEIDELMPSLNMYKQALTESMKESVNNNPKEDKNDDT